MKKEKVIIIGAGPAGLSAAYKLLEKKNQYDVTILEASHQIGGISKTVNYKGNRMDIGGHRFFSKEKEVVDFWNEIMPIQGEKSFDDKILEREKNLPQKGPNPEKEDNVMLLRNRVSRIYYSKKFFDYPISLKLKTFTNMGIKKTIKSGFSYLKSMFIKKEENCLENFYINRFGKQLYSMFFEKYTEKLWGRHPSVISADWGSQRVKGLSIITILKDIFHINKSKETSLIEEFMYPKYGPGQLWETVAEKIKEKGGKIEFNSEVVNINIKDNKIESVIIKTNKTTKEIKGDIFISSMPIKDLILGIKQKVPKQIKDIAANLPYRDFVTVGLLVNKLKIKNNTKIKTLNNIVPDCWIYVQEPDVKLGRIQIFNNWSPYMVKDKDTVWLGLEYFCNENDDFWNMSDKECINYAIEELAHIGIIEKEDVLDAHREKMKKAYPAYFDSYDRIDEVKDYLNKFQNLYCIGRNGQHRYNNMDHSMLTGFKTAEAIIEKKKDKSEIWNVNTEKEYHEEKKQKKKNHLPLLIGALILFEFFVFLLSDSFENSENIVFIELSAILSIMLFLKYRKKGKLETNDILFFILLIGILLRNLYCLKTPITVRQHDVDYDKGHLHYIYYLFEHYQLPNSNVNQFYQPPLHHILEAIWLQIATFIGIAKEKAMDGLKILTCLYSIFTLYYAKKIIQKLNLKDLYKIIIMIIMTVHPTFLILSGSINNDCLVVMLMTATTYYLIKWNEEPSTKNIIVLALTTGLSVMTKSNGALMAIPIIYIFLKKWIQKMKKEKKWNWNYIKQFIIFGIISLPIGIWFQTYQYLHFGHYAVPALTSINLEKHYTFVERFLSIDLKSLLITPFCTFINWIDTEHNIITYTIKSSIFGEFSYDQFINRYSYLFIILNSIIIIITLSGIILYTLNKKKDDTRNILLIIWIIHIISFFIFNLLYPYPCTMDFRYIVPTILSAITITAFELQNTKKQVGQIFIIFIFLFTLCSIAYALSL